MKNQHVYFIIALTALVCALSFAADWEVDPDHTSITFSIRHMMVANITGSFSQAKGKLTFDPSGVKKTQADVTIPAKTISTNNNDRDTHLKSPDFFDEPKFPVITFKSKRVEGTSFEKFKLVGDLTMHGVTKEVAFDAEAPTTTVKDPWGNIRRGMTAVTEINRKDFGLTWNKVIETGGVAVGEQVKIHVDLSLKTPKEASPAAKSAKNVKGL